MNNLIDVENLKTFLKHHGLKPRDYLGQNFLVDQAALQGIVAAAELQPGDVVLEVGPGLGVLTFELVKRAGRVIAVEKDSKLAELLRRNPEFNSGSRRKDPESIPDRSPGQGSGLQKNKVFNLDILKFNLSEHITGDYKVVANIPYYLTSKLLQTFLEMANKPTSMVLMVQKEVGERVTASAGELSILGISVQIYADAEIVLSVPKESFWPQPEVDSVVLKITPRDKYPEIKDKKTFFRIVKIAFAGKRKQIHNTLANGLKMNKEQTWQLLKQAGIEPTTRPQDLKIEQWVELYKRVAYSGQRSENN
ncbi:MAG: ribosomal RNA small subunit methyltransferase A [Candidatus Doudnabacteria bacterium RIFCSPLOWO2_02_FULL_49_13]|uniref:Ribosomal RNA small subunit methyltransferase A n=1 Tax=Candidatus Doudnabacteria bacterium RIFCSPHIGHO2_12_FULL_48_16 TaxID=1817838 RepID=A0A1F5PLB3_9BACT|nr:MAG: ribosomal RNA small subunit methyltransferase A [Candidatus Doudnabacteria bacterium RIFCSPHIGHO2_02_FULL_49_24]OGE89672.1 MAG: ribosomal RNA small subunit methyltransferase A [Candidatus Doudnabacteria bacterium RIFCSPHIGHO2_01_FULL_50_67]OGE90728.1 MAG: ribosomal RNA small subunit methyltransferase A [Candidatus Doudnabacteria bacterium RIFCSPHIGHO2_12_FULL_48_16]OGE96839.1 MAG: ribosomal RNA small subunit methyltransferase A [Candidatus Doudnabacteria bacterium RIFCSPLOWO2_01_FULL_49_